MSVLDRFEKSVEGAVNGVFAKFGSKDLQPVDLSSALEREIDKEAMPVTRDRTVAPNEYRFKLSTPDFNNIVEWGAEALANELADNLTQYAKDQHYAFVGPVVVIFEEDLDLTKSNFKLTSESVQGNTVPRHHRRADRRLPDAGNRRTPVSAHGKQDHHRPRIRLRYRDRRSGHLPPPHADRHHRQRQHRHRTRSGLHQRHVCRGHHVEAATLLDGNTITIGRTRILYWASSQDQE